LHACRTGPRELSAPALTIVRVQLPMPQERVAQPLFLSEAEHRFNVRADVDLVLVQAAIERSHECDGWNLLNERAIAGFGLLESVQGRGRRWFTISGRRRVTRDGRCHGGDYRNLRKLLEQGFGLFQAMWLG
jgi:hypothetical protein